MDNQKTNENGMHSMFEGETPEQHEARVKALREKIKAKPVEKPEEKKPVNHIKKVIGVMSGKGGVGKSFVTAMLASASAKSGNKTAIIDADLTGPSIPHIFGTTERAKGDGTGLSPLLTPKYGIKTISVNNLLDHETDAVIWRGPVMSAILHQFVTDVYWDDVDILFVDMPPGTGDVPLTIFQDYNVDGIVIVTSPQELVSVIVQKAVQMAEKMQIPIIGLIENMSYLNCPDCGRKIEVFGKSHISEAADKFNIPVLGKIPIDPKIAAAGDNGRIEDLTIPEFDKAYNKIMDFFNNK